jgi:CheY-like chemotaxis protein
MARYLIVDDDHATVLGMTRLLESDGHEVTPFTRGADAVDALASGAFDAVVTDLEMPHVDGHAVARATRALHPDACLVVASAKGEEDQEALAHAGVCIVADKPVDYEAITEAIRACPHRGGTGRHGRCHMRERSAVGRLVQLKRRR